MKITYKLIKNISYMNAMSILTSAIGLIIGRMDIVTIGVLVYISSLILPITLYVVHLVQKEEEGK